MKLSLFLVCLNGLLPRSLPLSLLALSIIQEQFLLLVGLKQFLSAPAHSTALQESAMQLLFV